MSELFTILGALTTVYVIDNYKKKQPSDSGKLYKEERNPKGFSKSVQDAINLITFSEDTNPVGSYKYRVHAYPSDIDIFEKVKKCCSVKEATNNVAKRLREIGRNIKKQKLIYLGDFKAGLEE